MASLTEIAARCDKVRWSGRHAFIACCVAHDDINPSMSIREAEDGTILARCHAGCSQSALVDALGLRGLPRSTSFTPVLPVDYTPTQKRARSLLARSREVDIDHPYLLRKNVPASGVRLVWGDNPLVPTRLRLKELLLCLPMRDLDRVVWDCQLITGTGDKAYLFGPRRSGSFFGISGGRNIWICEGFATGASLRAATGDSVACALDTGSLSAVAQALTQKYQDREIRIMADDDPAGLKAANEVGESYGLPVHAPDFDCLPREKKDNDYNDYTRLHNDGRN